MILPTRPPAWPTGASWPCRSPLARRASTWTEGRLLETTIYHPPLHPGSAPGPARHPGGLLEEFRNPCALYTTEDGSRYKVWYENEQSVLDKVALARMFGITGVSLWRIGNIPADGALRRVERSADPALTQQYM